MLDKAPQGNDVPVVEAQYQHVEGQKLELGPDLGDWENAKNTFTELNAKVKDGEKTWRLPTVAEATVIGRFCAVR